MHWGAPGLLWWSLLLGPAAVLAAWSARRQRLDSIALHGLMETGLQRAAIRRHWIADLALAGAFALLVAALCRPQWGAIDVKEATTGIDVVVVLDVSRSMLADDVAPSRLAAAKLSIDGWIAGLQGDRVGLVAFAGSAYQICPLTGDYAIFRTMLAEAGPGALPVGGTAIGAALTEARRALSDVSDRGRYVLLVSDGEDHGEDAGPGVQALREAGVRVHALAVGTDSGGLIPLANGDFVRDSQGAIVRTRTRPGNLEAIAKATGGGRIDLAAGLAGLHAAERDRLRKGTLERRQVRLEERYQWPLVLALLFLVVEPFVRRR